MDYRSHYAGDFETHLDLLAENIQQQKQWARDFRRLWIGIAASQLYDAEREPLVRIRSLLRERGPVAEVQLAFDKVKGRLAPLAGELHAAVTAYLREPKDAEALAAKLDAFLASPPSGYYPAERLTRTLERVRAQGVEGVVDLLRGRPQRGRPVAGGGGLLRPVAARPRLIEPRGPRPRTGRAPAARTRSHRPAPKAPRRRLSRAAARGPRPLSTRRAGALAGPRSRGPRS